MCVSQNIVCCLSHDDASHDLSIPIPPSPSHNRHNYPSLSCI
uniref:Uncharacterized protein n=1 Tax=Lepeophtheirus salmonis TaxID=72036 RepID=A0A0K2TAM1_LEPSM